MQSFSLLSAGVLIPFDFIEISLIFISVIDVGFFPESV